MHTKMSLRTMKTSDYCPEIQRNMMHLIFFQLFRQCLKRKFIQDILKTTLISLSLMKGTKLELYLI